MQRANIVKPKSPWATYHRRLPREVYNALLAAEAKIADVLELDIDKESPKRRTNLITVIEALALLVKYTEIERIKSEIEGSTK